MANQWARIIGIIVSVLGLITFGPLVAVGLLDQPGGRAILVEAIVLTVLFALAAWSLVKAGPYFAYRR